jgi:hypothetical protein
MPRFASLALALALAAPLAFAPAAEARDRVTVTIGAPSYGYGPSWADAVLSPRQIAHELERQSFVLQGRPALRGEVYTARAVDFSGRTFDLTIDAYDGSVVAARAVRVRHPGVPFQAIAARLSRDGYVRIVQVSANRSKLTLSADDRHGEPVEIIVDARTGRVLSVEYAEDCNENPWRNGHRMAGQ